MNGGGSFHLKKIFVLCSLAVAVLTGTAAAVAADTIPHVVPPSGISKNVLTNMGVALLAKAGYSEGFIIDIIHHKQTQFDVSAEGLAWLAGQGLSERIVRTMVANENKEQRTAIVPASIQVVTQPPSAVPTASATQAAASRTQKVPMQVSIGVAMPTPEPSPASWYVRSWEPDRWYIIPNIPMLAAPR
jgi:hypothetical protein